MALSGFYLVIAFDDSVCKILEIMAQTWSGPMFMHLISGSIADKATIGMENLHQHEGIIRCLFSIPLVVVVLIAVNCLHQYSSSRH